MELWSIYGTNIDTLVRRLLYLQVTEPGAKSIMFSASEDSLHKCAVFRLTRFQFVNDSVSMK